MTIQPPSFQQFLQSFGGTWLSLISGGLSVPFTAVGLFLPSGTAQISFFILAVVALWIGSYLTWSIERCKSVELQNRIAAVEDETPRLELIFDEKNPLCVKDEYYTQFNDRPPKSRHWSIGIMNTSKLRSIDNILIIARQSWFVDNTIVVVLENQRRKLQQKNPTIVFSCDTLQPKAEEFVPLFALEINPKGDVFQRKQEFTLEARGRNVETTTITLIYEPAEPFPIIKRKT
jgi:hypothetical protein